MVRATAHAPLGLSAVLHAREWVNVTEPRTPGIGRFTAVCHFGRGMAVLASGLGYRLALPRRRLHDSSTDAPEQLIQSRTREPLTD